MYLTTSGSSVASTGTGSIILTTVGAATYTMRGFANTGSFSTSNDGNGRTGVVWFQLTGG